MGSGEKNFKSAIQKNSAFRFPSLEKRGQGRFAWVKGRPAHACPPTRDGGLPLVNQIAFSAIQRQRHRKHRSFTHLTFNRDVSAQKIDEFLDNG
jgi:hypothetical protein